ncbi:MAG: hypothetical protein Q8N99_04765 [Nanoarchaeota archaeon]|nr:hypothetical protein [Nanoarchaeota archaeon]
MALDRLLKERISRRAALTALAGGVLGLTGLSSSVYSDEPLNSDEPLKEHDSGYGGSISGQNPRAYPNNPSFRDFINTQNPGFLRELPQESIRDSETRWNNSDLSYRRKVYQSYADEQGFAKSNFNQKLQIYMDFKKSVEAWLKYEHLIALERKIKGYRYDKKPINIFKKSVDIKKLRQEYREIYPWITNPENPNPKDLPLIFDYELAKGRLDLSIINRKYDSPKIRIVD